MSCTLYFNDRGWDVMTTAWTAGSKNGKDTDIRYTWGADGVSFFDNSVSTAQYKIALPFNSFARYVQDCQKTGEVADLREANIPHLARKYSAAPPAP